MLQAIGVKESAGLSSYVSAIWLTSFLKQILEEQELAQHAQLLHQARERFKQVSFQAHFQITADDSVDSDTASKEEEEPKQPSKEVKRKLEAIRAEAKFYLPDASDLD